MIGNGSFGKVFQVMHKCSKKVYAMKQLSKSKLISKRQIKYAVSECNILK
jgi:serum/glucocorticoid-regulated kinase 2